MTMVYPPQTGAHATAGFDLDYEEEAILKVTPMGC